MNSATNQLEVVVLQVQTEQDEVSPLTLDQLLLVGGGECVVNSI